MDMDELRWLGLAALPLLLAGCKDESVIYLTRLSAEDPGANCADGGQTLDFGPDADGDGVLSDEEATATAFVCNGADSRTVKIDTAPLPVGDPNCPAGGHSVTVGIDSNSNDTIDADEGTTRYLCNAAGAAGPAGAQGPRGDAGAPGPQGNPGQDGLTPLVVVTAEPEGANCTFGGTKIEVGLDDDGDKTLGAGEVDSTSFVCGAKILDGSTAERANSSCRAIVQEGLSRGDGLYFIDPDRFGTAPPFQVFCDMTRDGGGFVLALVQDVDTSWSCLTSSDAPLDPETPSATVLSHEKFAALGADEMFVFETGGSRVLKFYYPRPGVDFVDNYRSLTERTCFDPTHAGNDGPHTGRARVFGLPGGHIDQACTTGNFAAWKARSDCNIDATNSQPTWGNSPGEGSTYLGTSDCWFHGGASLTSVPSLTTCPPESRAPFASYEAGSLSGVIQVWVR